MSYILDALKRADAERERGVAPGLHTHHQMPAGNAGTPGGRRAVWIAAAVGLTLVVLAIFVWLWRTPDAPPMATVQPVASPMPDRVAPAQPAVSAAPVPPVAPSTPAAPVTSIAPVPIVVAEPPVARPMSTEKTSPKAVSEPAITNATPAVSAKPAKPAASATPVGDAAVTPVPAPPASAAASAPTATQAAPLLGELPAALRSQIPKITITGSVYSDSPAQRLLLVNNLVLSQGDQVSPDLKLEEIQPRSSVFSYKGTRFRVMH